MLVFIALLPLPWQYTKLFLEFLDERKIRSRLCEILASLLEETKEGFKNKASISIYDLALVIMEFERSKKKSADEDEVIGREN